MALQAEQLDEKSEENNRAFLIGLETRIDKSLRDAYKLCNPSEITIKIPSGGPQDSVHYQTPFAYGGPYDK